MTSKLMLPDRANENFPMLYTTNLFALTWTICTNRYDLFSAQHIFCGSTARIRAMHQVRCTSEILMLLQFVTIYIQKSQHSRFFSV